MAEKIIRTLIDDMETDEVDADAGTVSFGLDGRNYEIDLSRKNATRLRTFLQEFIDHARPAGRTKGQVKAVTTPPRKAGAPSGYNREQLSAIRHWARRNGYPDLSSKGRVPAEIIEAYENAHESSDKPYLFSAL